MRIGDETFRNYVLKEHMAQVLHKLLVIDLWYTVHVAAAETKILYKNPIRYSDDTLQ